MPKSQWFVIHTLSGQEQKVKENIEKRVKRGNGGLYQRSPGPGGESGRCARRQEDRDQPQAASGYVYIEMVLLDDEKRILEKPWYFIQDTPGKIGIVGGDRPFR